MKNMNELSQSSDLEFSMCSLLNQSIISDLTTNDLACILV